MYCYIVDEGVHVSFGISGSSSFILYVSQEHDYVQMHDTKDRGPTSIENLNRGIYWLHNNDQRRWWLLRSCKSSSVPRMLRQAVTSLKRIWGDEAIINSTKLWMLKQWFISVSINTAELWIVQKHDRKDNTFDMGCYYRLRCINWTEKKTNWWVLGTLQCKHVHVGILQKYLYRPYYWRIKNV